MRWLHAGNRRAKHADARHAAVVVAVTTPLNRETALEVRRKVDLLDAYEEVVIDLTAIPAFDTDGADALFAIQGEQVDRRVSIVGFRQATARLLGPDPTSLGEDVPAEASHAGGAGWAVRRLRNLLVVQPEDVSAPAVTGLEETLGRATSDANAAIIVLDLRGVQRLPANVVEAVAFASSTAALRGQELLVVNVQAEAIEALRAAGLSATTFVAPEPFDAEPFGRERFDTGPFDRSPYGETPRDTPANPGDARQR